MLAVVYLGFAVYFFSSHFMFFTTINGTDVTLKSVSQVEEYMRQQVADYTLTLEESDGGYRGDLRHLIFPWNTCLARRVEHNW